MSKTVKDANELLQIFDTLEECEEFCSANPNAPHFCGYCAGPGPSAAFSARGYEHFFNGRNYLQWAECLDPYYPDGYAGEEWLNAPIDNSIPNDP